jgi:hypothetical protein
LLADQGLFIVTDGFHRIPSERLRAAALGLLPTEKKSGEAAVPADKLEESFTHYTCPSLAHLIALLCRPTAACIPQNTRLVVIDSLSALVNHAYPRTPESRTSADAKGNKGTQIKTKYQKQPE